MRLLSKLLMMRILILCKKWIGKKWLARRRGDGIDKDVLLT